MWILVWFVCVYYLPPEGSTRNIVVNDVYETLLSQIYVYQNDGMFYICSDLVDCIEGLDHVPKRETIDFKHNL